MSDAKTAHTPGPWNYGTTGDVMRGYSQPFAVVQTGASNLVAGVFGDVAGGEAVAKANARLIASAPELEAAVHNALHRLIDLRADHMDAWHIDERTAVDKDIADLRAVLFGAKGTS